MAIEPPDRVEALELWIQASEPAEFTTTGGTATAEGSMTISGSIFVRCLKRPVRMSTECT